MKSILSVLTASKSIDLAKLSTVRDELSVKDRASDATLQRYITQASAAIGNYCNRVFGQQDYQEVVWATRDDYPFLIPGGLDKVQLSRWPVVDVTSVVENDVALVEDVDFRVSYDDGMLFRLDGNGDPKLWPALKTTVQYSAGYDLPDGLPPDIEDACIRMVKARWMARGRDPFLKAENIPGVRSKEWWVSTTPTGNMTPDIADILDNYRCPVVA